MAKILSVKLFSGPALANDQFGTVVAFSPDGKYLVVTEPTGGKNLNGLVSMFNRNSVGSFNITPLIIFTSTNPALHEAFGNSIAFNPNSTSLAIGTQRSTIIDGIKFSGNVQIFEQNTIGHWINESSKILKSK